VTDDALIVDGRLIPGEDQRASQIRSRLDAGTPAAQLGPEWVLVEGPGVPRTTLAGLDIVYSGPTLTLYHNPSMTPPAVASTQQRTAMATAYLVPLAVILFALGLVVAAPVRRLYRRERAARRRRAA
jgi:hypothetical protein